MKPIKVAIFGTGFMGRVHLDALRRQEFVEIVAIAGRNLEVARKLGAGFGVSAITNDYREILRDPAVDAVHILQHRILHVPKHTREQRRIHAAPVNQHEQFVGKFIIEPA